MTSLPGSPARCWSSAAAWTACVRRRLAEAVAKTIPGARYIEIRTGHYMAVQTPDLLADTIDGFLNSVGA